MNAAVVAEGAWASLCSAARRHFDPPKTGKTAIKFINLYGDEVLKVYQIQDWPMRMYKGGRPGW